MTTKIFFKDPLSLEEFDCNTNNEEDSEYDIYIYIERDCYNVHRFLQSVRQFLSSLASCCVSWLLEIPILTLVSSCLFSSWSSNKSTLPNFLQSSVFFHVLGNHIINRVFSIRFIMSSSILIFFFFSLIYVLVFGQHLIFGNPHGCYTQPLNTGQMGVQLISLTMLSTNLTSTILRIMVQLTEYLKHREALLPQGHANPKERL